eukprot:TRINITY_DN13673_c0_g1_i1.p1 TRINITY_DN13673_c0_g1~~TRINITY_DN13673_c0_g1_i1.p1  ORF type:complete len:311 (+),score=39.54 TRINITY_DN13673_c0_g1_i1:112-1044(+)
MSDCFRPLTIGVDIGGVIIEKGPPSDDHDNFHEDVVIGSNTTYVPGAAAALQQLISIGHEVHLISFADRAREAEMRPALARGFLNDAGIDQGHLHFTRSCEDKLPVCEAYQVDVMIDDTFNVLSALAGQVPHCIWFRGKFDNPPLRSCPTWPAVLQYIARVAATDDSASASAAEAEAEAEAVDMCAPDAVGPADTQLVRQRLNIGVDIGGVIIEKDMTRDPHNTHDDADEDTVIGEHAVFVSGAARALRRLLSMGHIVHLISYAGKQREADTRRELTTGFLRAAALTKHTCISHARAKTKRPCVVVCTLT